MIIMASVWKLRLKEASQAAEGELRGYCNDLGIKGGGLSFASEDAE